MTINTKKVVSGPYKGNGLADTFSYTFKIDNKEEVSVYETDDSGVQVQLVLDVDYIVNNTGNNGTITRTAGPLPVNYEWYIRSNYEETQLTAFQSQGAFFPDLHEKAMDKLTMLIQQILDKLTRTFTLSESFSGKLPLSLEDPDAHKVLRWNSNVDGIENFDSDYAYTSKDGDTMRSPLSGPNSIKSDDYMPQLQIAETIDARMSSAPEFDPSNFQDYGLVTEAVTDSNDYGSI